MISFNPTDNIILSYNITHFIWDLRHDKIKVRVEYQTTLRKVLMKEYEFEPKDHIDINELIDEVKKLHDGDIQKTN